MCTDNTFLGGWLFNQGLLNHMYKDNLMACMEKLHSWTRICLLQQLMATVHWYCELRSKSSDAGIVPSVQRLSYSLYVWGIWLQFLAGLHSVHTSTGTNIVSNQMVTVSLFPRAEESKPWTWPLTSIKFQDLECMELYPHFPMNSWNGA